MGLRLRICFLCALCLLLLLLLLLAVHGSKGSVAHFLGEHFKEPHVFPVARRIVLQITSGTPSTAIDMRLRPSRMPDTSVHIPVKIEVSPVIPHEPSSAYSVKSQSNSALSPFNTTEGSVSQPPIMLLRKFEAMPLTIQAAKPPMPTSAPSDHVSIEHKHPRSVSYSAESQTPEVLLAKDLSPFFMVPPLVQIRKGIPRDGEKAPKNNSLVPRSPATTPSINGKRFAMPVAVLPKGTSLPTSDAKNSHSKGAVLVISPATHDTNDPSNTTNAPFISHSQPPDERVRHNPASSPTISVHKHISRKPRGNPLIVPSSPAPFASHIQPPQEKLPQIPSAVPMVSIRQQMPRERVGNRASSPLSPLPPSSHRPEAFSRNSPRRHASPPHIQARPTLSPVQAPSSPNEGELAPVPSPSPVIPSGRYESSLSPTLSPSRSFSRNQRAPASQAIPTLPHRPPNLGPTHPPVMSPSESLSWNMRTPEPQPMQALPPPPPNLDCTSLTCSEPMTNTPPGAPCTCVLPMKVELRLSIALYMFFPLVSELAQEIASGVFMKQSQVRIMGANAASEEPDKTVVLLDLVPLGFKFDNTTAFLTYEKFWHKQVPIKASFFGDYDVLYVLYPGLSPPPTAPADINAGDGTFVNSNNGRMIKPLGVDVPKRKNKLNGSLIAIIVLSSVIAVVLIVGAAWLLLLRHGDHTHLHTTTPQTLLPPFAKSSVAGTGTVVLGSRHSSTSASFSSGIATYKGSAKAFTLSEMERATKRFDDSRIIGEGGFGRVYEGTLDDGIKVAVKVLKRDDHQGGREFLAEVEMLGRLHHRNLVKLIGISTEEIRCLVYELVPNGSVESHLHGVDKETAPLDWRARTKIALGAARGLAYLHEDSSPRVIHRDFKASNILLEHDYTPKVSDFGLARTALDDGNEQIATRVMGTFGYVAPEYAMTGHLLVKSDVYSYGVVLLELLTGRKPVDMLQPTGQENLVTWARPLLASREYLQTIIDPALGTNYPFDSVAKVAAIASMCVQPEVSYRPFMGEVVQALKLVSNEGDEYRASASCSQDYSSAHGTEIRTSVGLGPDLERLLSTSDIFSTSARFTQDASGSFRRHSSSGPLTTGKGWHYWQRVRALSTGSMSDHDLSLKSGVGLDSCEEYP